MPACFSQVRPPPQFNAENSTILKLTLPVTGDENRSAPANAKGGGERECLKSVWNLSKDCKIRALLVRYHSRKVSIQA
jgi:hypothetical protein